MHLCSVACVVLFAVLLQTTTLAASPSRVKAKRVTLTDGMTMPLTGVCVFVLKVVPNNRAVNLSTIEDVSAYVRGYSRYGCVLQCYLRWLVSMVKRSKCTCTNAVCCVSVCVYNTYMYICMCFVYELSLYDGCVVIGL